MQLDRLRIWIVTAVLLAIAAGCGSDKTPESAPPEPEPVTKTAPVEETPPVVKEAPPPAAPPAPAPKVEPTPKKAELKTTEPKAAQNPVVVMTTSKGVMRIELDPVKAPLSTENFLKYVDDKYYDGTVFHRVIPNFMIQGGGFTAAMEKKDTRPPIQNEAKNGLRNLRGTIAMARTQNPHSATAQFYINHVDNAMLDQASQPPGAWGYAVFGKVIEGLDVVDAIAGVRTGFAAGMEDVPTEPVVIQSVRRAQ